MIKVGDVAPDFTLKTQDDKEFKLSDHKGKTVVLLWYPLDWSPTCEKENCAVSNEKSLYGADRVVVGISRDSVWSHKAWKEAKNIGHDLLADPLLEVTTKYGLVHPAAKFISTFQLSGARAIALRYASSAFASSGIATPGSAR